MELEKRFHCMLLPDYLLTTRKTEQLMLIIKAWSMKKNKNLKPGIFTFHSHSTLCLGIITHVSGAVSHTRWQYTCVSGFLAMALSLM